MVFYENSDFLCFLFGRESIMSMFPFKEKGIIGITVVPEDEEHLGRKN